MSLRRSIRTRVRGSSLIEVMVAMAIMAFSLLGITSLQIIAARAHTSAWQSGWATALATDLCENIGTWQYSDARLATSETISTTGAQTVTDRTTLGQTVTITDPTKKPTFAEGTTNGLTNSALYGGGTAYDGTKADVDGDGVLDFERYWSVFKLDANGDGTEEGKLVVVTIRWFQPPFGYRQLNMSTYVANQTSITQ